jgi:hypothetical protein
MYIYSQYRIFNKVFPLSLALVIAILWTSVYILEMVLQRLTWGQFFVNIIVTALFSAILCPASHLYAALVTPNHRTNPTSALLTTATTSSSSGSSNNRASVFADMRTW